MKSEILCREMTHEIIGAAIRVHKELGPGEEEAVYEEALCLALEDQGVSRSLAIWQ